MTSQDNLKMIIESLPSDTPEIQHIILKSQINKKQKKGLWVCFNDAGVQTRISIR